MKISNTDYLVSNANAQLIGQDVCAPKKLNDCVVKRVYLTEGKKAEQALFILASILLLGVPLISQKFREGCLGKSVVVIHVMLKDLLPPTKTESIPTFPQSIVPKTPEVKDPLPTSDDFRSIFEPFDPISPKNDLRLMSEPPDPRPMSPKNRAEVLLRLDDA